MKCLICDKETTHQYSMGDDSPKMSYCKKHEIHVTTYVIQLTTDNNFNAEQWLKKVRQNESKGTKGTPTKKGK